MHASFAKFYSRDPIRFEIATLQGTLHDKFAVSWGVKS